MPSSHSRLATTTIVGLFVAASCTSGATPAPATTPTASPSIGVTSPTPSTSATSPTSAASPTPATPAPPPPDDGPTYEEISASGGHTCARTTHGGVKCWGDWIYSVQGSSQSSGTLAPVGVPGLDGGISAISAGVTHVCTLTDGGAVKCWGSNELGKLGDGTITDSTVPVDVSRLPGEVQAISAGGNHTCALTSSGGVTCWGANTVPFGSGNTPIYSSEVPFDVGGLASGVIAIAAGGAHDCALTNGGGVKCWGINDYGALGNGNTYTTPFPVDVSGLDSGVSAITAGFAHSCALTSSGGVTCWGANYHGQLGDGTTTDSTVPVDVSRLPGEVQAISAGGNHTCALTSSGGVKCWGANYAGQLGTGTTTQSLVPVDVSGLESGAVAMSAGWEHTCALMVGGGVTCWGANYGGQLGTGTTIGSSVPVDVGALQVDPLLGSIVVTVSDRLRVRSQPRVSDDSIKYEPVLPLGTHLLVFDGPVRASGYTWYKVAPTLYVGLNGPGYGWVAKAGTDGEPWIGPAE